MTFVLRLSPAAIDSDTATSFAHTQDNKEPPVQCYRRKPPSQIRRDQKRAEERKGKVCQQASDFSSLRLFATPSDKEDSRPTDDSTPLLHSRHNTAEDARATRCDSCVLYNDDLCTGVSVITHAEDSFCDIKQDKHRASLDPLNIVQNYVAELMDRPLQHHLRDTHRNNKHHRVATNNNQDKPLMIFETDGMVLCTIRKDGLPVTRQGKSPTGLLNKTPSACFRKRWIISKSIIYSVCRPKKRH